MGSERYMGRSTYLFLCNYRLMNFQNTKLVKDTVLTQVVSPGMGTQYSVALSLVMFSGALGCISSSG